MGVVRGGRTGVVRGVVRGRKGSADGPQQPGHRQADASNVFSPSLSLCLSLSVSFSLSLSPFLSLSPSLSPSHYARSTPNAARAWWGYYPPHLEPGESATHRRMQSRRVIRNAGVGRLGSEISAAFAFGEFVDLRLE